MKRLSFTILTFFFTLVLAAQDGIRVKSTDTQPTIIDFAKAYIASMHDDEEEGECQCGNEAIGWIENALNNYQKGLPQVEGVTIIVDVRNGYICCESRYENSYIKTDMCYWNEADGKHKLFAYNTWCFQNDTPAGGQFDGIGFYRYNNATKTMEICETPGFTPEYLNTTYSLPRKGKDIIETKWDQNGKKTNKTLKWNGRRFVR